VATEEGPIDVTVIVPVRNAAAILPECLDSVVRQQPTGIVVVDGNSIDDTVDIARRYGVTILSDEGKGLPVARMLGAQEARTRYVALVDADVVLPDGSLRRLLGEYVSGRYGGLQAGLHSEGGKDYWSRALAQHHRWGRSKNWFGLVATIFERQTLLDIGFDERFISGEDIELRWRMVRAGHEVGVSRTTVVTHRFAGGGFALARSQFEMDGRGLASMVVKNGWRGLPLLGLPAAAAVRGIVISVLRLRPQWVPYYICFAAGNYAAMVGRLTEHTKAAW